MYRGLGGGDEVQSTNLKVRLDLLAERREVVTQRSLDQSSGHFRDHTTLDGRGHPHVPITPGSRATHRPFAADPFAVSDGGLCSG